jgi:tetraacyldisaccharide 4'-kinase
VRDLITQYQPDIIISDDGLQHYAMGRAVEIVVVDVVGLHLSIN